MTAVVHAIAWMLINFAWEGVLIAVATAVVLELLAFRSARARYLVACVGLLAMLLAPVLSLAVAWAPGISAPVLSGFEVATSSASGLELREPPLFTRPATAARALNIRFDPDSILSIVVALWAAGVLLLLVRLTVGWWRVRRLHRTALASELSSWQGRCEAIAHCVGVTRLVRVVESAYVDAPSVVGCLRPVILLPVAAMSGLTPTQVEAILAHELAHIRRHDFLVNLLQSIVETLLFYHPAVWWMSARVRAEREYCCDDVAVAFAGDAVSYASALAELEARRAAAGSMVLAATGGSLLDRIGRLLRVPSVADGQGTGWLVTLVLTLVFVAGAGVTQWLPDTTTIAEVLQVQPAPVATPAQPAPPSTLAERPESVARDGLSVRLRDEEFRMRWSEGFNFREVRASGDLTFTDDLTDVQALSSGGVLLVREWTDILPRSVEVQSVNGRLMHRYFVAGFERKWTSDSQRWLADRLPALVRRSGLGARSRVRQIFAARGVDGVFDEINNVEGDYARHLYLDELKVIAAPLDSSLLVRVIAFAGAAINSDHYLAETLRDIAPLAVSDLSATRAYADAADRIDSDYEHKRALVALFKAGKRAAGSEDLALASAANIHSSFERVEVLRVAVQEGWSGTGESLFKAIAELDSDFEKRRILLVTLKTPSSGSNVEKQQLAAAATIDSDFECAEFLIAFLKQSSVDAAAQTAFFDAVDTIDSSFERRRVLTSLVRGDQFSRELLPGVLASVSTMESDYDRAELLLLLLKRQPVEAAARETLFNIVENMGSSYEQGRVLVALVKAGRQ